jgi:hypothetical protein
MPEMLDFCHAAWLDFIFDVAPTKTLRHHVEAVQASTRQRQAYAQGAEKLPRYKEFYDGAASWSRVERIISRIEANPQGVDTRFFIISLKGSSAQSLYESTSGQSLEIGRDSQVHRTVIHGLPRFSEVPPCLLYRSSIIFLRSKTPGSPGRWSIPCRRSCYLFSARP